MAHHDLPTSSESNRFSNSQQLFMPLPLPDSLFNENIYLSTDYHPQGSQTETLIPNYVPVTVTTHRNESNMQFITPIAHHNSYSLSKAIMGQGTPVSERVPPSYRHLAGSRMSGGPVAQQAGRIQKRKISRKYRKLQIGGLGPKYPTTAPTGTHNTKAITLFSLWNDSHPTELPTDDDYSHLGRMFSMSPVFIQNLFKHLFRSLSGIEDDSGYQTRSSQIHTLTKKYEGQQKIHPKHGQKAEGDGRNITQLEWICTTGCRRRFGNKSSWKNHESRHYPQDIWVCPHCSKTFPRRDHFKSHLSNHHAYSKVTDQQCKNNSHSVNSRFPRFCNYTGCDEIFDDWKGRIGHIADHMRAGSNPEDWAGVIDEQQDGDQSSDQDSISDSSERSDNDMNIRGSDDDDDFEDSQGGPSSGSFGFFDGSGTSYDSSYQGHSGPQDGSNNAGSDSYDFQFDPTSGGYGGCQGYHLTGLANTGEDPAIEGPIQITESCDKTPYLQTIEQDCAEISATHARNMINDLQYSSLRWLGSGSTATVDEVKEPGSIYTMARKVIQLRHSKGRKQVNREAYIMHRLRHSHFVQLLRTWSDTSTTTLLMKPAADYSLSYYIRTCSVTKPPKRSTWRWFSCLVSGLQYMHTKSYFHGDIKPDNILVFNQHILYSDFGLSNMITDDISNISDGGFMTKQYAAPEVKVGKRGKASDIWSLGCVFLELLTVLLQRSVKDFYNTRKLKQKGDSKDFSYSANLGTVASWINGLKEIPSPSSHSSLIATVLNCSKAMLMADLNLRPTVSELAKLIPPKDCCISFEFNTAQMASTYGLDYPTAFGTAEKQEDNTVDTQTGKSTGVSFSLRLWLREMSGLEALLCGYIDVDTTGTPAPNPARLELIKKIIGRLSNQIFHPRYQAEMLTDRVLFSHSPGGLHLASVQKPGVDKAMSFGKATEIIPGGSNLASVQIPGVDEAMSSGKATEIMPGGSHLASVQIPGLDEAISSGKATEIMNVLCRYNSSNPDSSAMPTVFYMTKVKSNDSSDHPDDLQKHQRTTGKMWTCVDCSLDKTKLAKCKHCQDGKKYGAYYNAAAHPESERSQILLEDKRSGKTTGVQWPPMSELLKRMVEKEETMTDGEKVVDDAELQSVQLFQKSDYNHKLSFDSRLNAQEGNVQETGYYSYRRFQRSTSSSLDYHTEYASSARTSATSLISDNSTSSARTSATSLGSCASIEPTKFQRARTERIYEDTGRIYNAQSCSDNRSAERAGYPSHFPSNHRSIETIINSSRSPSEYTSTKMPIYPPRSSTDYRSNEMRIHSSRSLSNYLPIVTTVHSCRSPSKSYRSAERTTSKDQYTPSFPALPHIMDPSKRQYRAHSLPPNISSQEEEYTPRALPLNHNSTIYVSRSPTDLRPTKKKIYPLHPRSPSDLRPTEKKIVIVHSHSSSARSQGYWK